MSVPILLIAMLQAASVQATPVPEPGKPDIVVDARNSRVIREFVKQMADPGPGDQIARWDGAICSGVIGLDREQAQMVNDRIAQLASAVRLRIGKPGCKPSVLIVFTGKADALANAVANKFPVSLRREGSWRLNRFRQPRQPVRWIAKTYDDGAETAIPSFDSVTTGTALPSSESSGYSAYASRIGRITRAGVSSMLIIVDPAQTGPAKLDALADYLTMVALVRPLLGAAPPTTSVLSLFASAAPPTGVTGLDQTYLKALYSSAPSQSSAGQISSIRTAMRRNGSVETP